MLYAETMFVERPEDGSARWRLWDYQKPSLRTRRNVINRSAAGTGKTRELQILGCWGITCRAGQVLVVANQDSTVATIWRNLEFQTSRNPWLAMMLPAEERKQRPRRTMIARNGNVWLFVPTGPDGEPLRGEHCANFVLGDEADRWVEREIFNEFWRAVEPGCEVRLYSVPTGRTDTEFYGLIQRSTQLADLEADPDADPVAWGQVWWRKPDRPDWDEAERARWVAQYGSTQADGYRRNVLGELGRPHATVFAPALLRAASSALAEYRALGLVVDEAAGTVEVSVDRCHPAATWESDASARLLRESMHRLRLNEIDWRPVLASALRLEPGPYALGADLGYQDDPTEIVVVRLHAERRLVVGRIHVERLDYPRQAELLAALLEQLRPTYGLGFDATGVGTAVEHSLRRLVAEDEISGFRWNASTPLLDPHSLGPVTDAAGRAQTVSLKERATQLLELALQQAALELPHDPALRRELENHTATVAPSGQRRFARTNDHILDALRAALLRALVVDEGQLGGLAPFDALVVAPRRSRLVVADPSRFRTEQGHAPVSAERPARSDLGGAPW
ncbi:MAG: hypothetical protein AAGC60_30615 [Acidobacteriota bacterium]